MKTINDLAKHESLVGQVFRLKTKSLQPMYLGSYDR